ncbi:MAG: DNA-directed RNA polymerase subunit omega [Halanaerobacter sp.]
MLAGIQKDEVIEKCGGSTFVAAVIAAKRAREIHQEKNELLDEEEYNGVTPVSKAYEEIVAGKIKPKEK